MEYLQNFIDYILEHLAENCSVYYDMQDKGAVICKVVTKTPQFYDKLEEKLDHMLRREEIGDYLITNKGTAKGVEYLVFLRTNY